MSVVSMKALLEAGVHFGHRTRRWNPKMKSYIFTERNGIHIIDLQQTLVQLDRAYDLVRDTVSKGGSILFVGTKKQAQETIVLESTRCAMPYVNQRWLGGTLTNWKTIRQRIDQLLDLEAQQERGEFNRLTKKEARVICQICSSSPILCVKTWPSKRRTDLRYLLSRWWIPIAIRVLSIT